jgi:amino acid transporter
MGALCYAELATAYPSEGGDFVYQTRAYGRWAGFLFGWSQVVIIRPGDIAMMAFVFARYGRTLWAPFGNVRADQTLYAAAAIVVLTTINCLGVRKGKWTQNVLTVVKVVGLLAIVAVGLLAPLTSGTHAGPEPAVAAPAASVGLRLALILVLFTFGGWNEMAYVAAEVRKPKRNILRALVIGTVAVTALYVLVNAAFLSALGWARTATSQAVAVDTVARTLPGFAARAIGVLVCVSALGAANGLIFTGARISYALGREHAAFRPLGKWHGRSGSPVWALVAQGALALAIVAFAGSFIDTILYTAPAVWLFFLATGLSVFVLRHRDPGTERPYKVTGYTFTASVFCASCAFMLYSCVSYALEEEPTGLRVVSWVLVVGGVVYLLTQRFAPKKEPPAG